MKKVLKVVVPLLVLVALIFLAKTYFFSGRSSFQSVYMVPPDAVMIIETDAAFDAWDKIIHSDAWEKISNVEALASLNEEIQALDSILSNKKLLLKAIGRRKVLFSIHPYQTGKYDYLYVLNVGRAARARNPEKMLGSLLGEEYQITTRNYNEHAIVELLDIASGEMYIFSFVNDKVILSTNFKLVEASLDEMDIMTLGRDHDFINISKRISGKGLFNVYINYTTFPDYLKSTMGKTSEGVQELEKALTYSAFSFNMSSEGMITLEGYTGVVDSVSSFYNSALNAGSGKLESGKVIPARVASMLKISFGKLDEYYDKALNNLSDEEKASFIDTQKKLEKKLKISIKDNFLSWIDDEIVLLQTQPSNLGRSNEFAAIIKGKNEKDPKKNMDFVERQIKKNSPVKIKKVDYNGYSISYISFPGLLKALFGKTLGKIEKPYYTFINEFVIFSNHPQTLKNIIDDFEQGNTLENSIEYYNFSDNFDCKTSAFTYFDVPVLFSNLKEFVDADTWNKLNKNKPYITCFPKAGIQLDQQDNMFYFRFMAEFSKVSENYKVQRFNANSFLSLFSENAEEEIEDPNKNWDSPKIIIHNLDDSKLEEFFANGDLRFEVSLKDGVKHGNYKLYYPDGELKVRGKFKDDLRTGSWKLYDPDGNILQEKLFSDGKEKTE